MTTATVIDGKAFAAAVAALVAEDAAQLTVAGVPPTLAVILVGDDPASGIYVRNKAKRAERVDVRSHVITLPASATTAQVLAEVVRLNNDSSVHGILVQLPLPKQVSTQAVIEAIAPEKDVDGFHPVNVGRLTALGPSQARVPCTPLGAWLLLRYYCGDLTGKQAVVIGRSNIVGKPMASLLLHESCTVIQAHSRTVDTATLCRTADIIVACVGKPGLVRADWVKDGATLIDVGINRVERDGGYVVCGDIDEAACVRAANYTPVPGGIGPMTIACLLANTVCACVAQREDDTAGYALMNTYVTRLTRR